MVGIIGIKLGRSRKDKVMEKEWSLLFQCILRILLFISFIAISVAILMRTPLFSEQAVYFYRLAELNTLCSLFLFAATFFIYRKKAGTKRIPFSSAVLCIGLAMMFMVFFFSICPTIYDRSYTVYTLADLTDHADGSYQEEELERGFINGYVEEGRENKRRIDEQAAIGNLEEESGKYRITDKGRRLVRFFRLVEKLYPVQDEHSLYPNGR